MTTMLLWEVQFNVRNHAVNSTMNLISRACMGHLYEGPTKGRTFTMPREGRWTTIIFKVKAVSEDDARRIARLAVNRLRNPSSINLEVYQLSTSD